MTHGHAVAVASCHWSQVVSAASAARRTRIACLSALWPVTRRHEAVGHQSKGAVGIVVHHCCRFDLPTFLACDGLGLRCRRVAAVADAASSDGFGVNPASDPLTWRWSARRPSSAMERRRAVRSRATCARTLSQPEVGWADLAAKLTRLPDAACLHYPRP
jgi:hypothetical protein